jgi:hypothetical protein
VTSGERERERERCVIHYKMHALELLPLAISMFILSNDVPFNKKDMSQTCPPNTTREL